jgi:3-hydroxyisobutyrate dehydrogenase
MVGGSEEGFEKVKPILQLMGKKYVLCGEAGSGGIAKLCNNLSLAISMVI